ncbi:MAG: monofunctional biosynthetic peptidoglycan transglycosylase [Sphingomonas sp.]|nr:monofunctional biosynthetic peptidoglycan transglycosylase [Sphingomonas sp.]
MAKRPTPTIPRYKRHRARSWPRRMLGWIVKAVLIFLLASLLWVLAYRFINPPITATMMGDVLAGRGATRDWMPIGRIDRDMVRAAIGGEDSKFCSHNGFDLDAIEQAMQRNASGGRIRGGSTISQQTAKNAFLWQGGGYFRKGLEAWFTVLMEAMWPKQRIMEVYLNLAETGIGTYGVNAGAQRYFRHDASAMSRMEAARIAAVLPLPKKRGATAPKGFTRRYGGTIAARIGAVAREGLDACVYDGITPPKDKAPPPSRAPRTLPGEEYETARPLPPLEDVVQELLPASDEPLIGEPAPATNPAAPEPELPPSEPPAVEEIPPPAQ